MSIRRSSSIAVNRENPRLSSSFMANKSHTQENESFCHDKLESIHFESQELQAQVESLISKMKNDINLQSTFRAEAGYVKVKREDYASYYNQLKDVYKGVRKLSHNWDSLFEDYSAKHSQSLAKKNKEVETLNNHYKYKLKALEFEKKSAMEAQKNDLLRREQDLSDAIYNFLNSLKAAKKTWNNNLNDLHFCVQEQNHSITYLSEHKAAKLKAFSNEIDSLFTEMTPHKGLATMSTRHGRETNQKPFNDVINLSPINPKLPQTANMDQLNSCSKEEESHIVLPSTKREREQEEDHGVENSINILELFAHQKTLGEQSKLSPNRSGWDSKLEDEESMEQPEADKIERALELLLQQGMLEPQAVNTFTKIAKMTDSIVDRDIQMNLFKDLIKLELKRQNKDDRNQDLPFRRTSRIPVNDENRIPEQSLRRKVFQGTSTTGDPKYMMGELNYTASENGQTHQQVDFSSGEKTILQTEAHLPKILEDKKLRKKKVDEKKKRNKNDVSLTDLLKVKDYSFVLESPLSTHNSREEVSFQQFQQHVEKDDLLKADSLPLTMKEAELSKIMPEKRKEKEINPEDLINNLNNLNNTKRRDRMVTINEKQRRNPGEIKIIEEFKNSLNHTQEAHPHLQEESYNSSERSSPYISSQKRRLLHQDDTQLEWETNMDSKGNVSRRIKTSTNPGGISSDGHPTLVSTTSILKDRTREVPSPGLYSHSVIGQEGVGAPLPQSIKDVRSSTSTINSVKAGNRSEMVKGNPIRRLANKSGLKNSHFTTESSHTRISTQANTGFNEGEIDSTHNVPLTMYTSLSHSEPLLRLHHDKYSFSHLVETEAGGEEKINLNSSFPPYWQNGEKNKKGNIVTKFPIKRHGNSTAMGTAIGGWGSKNLSTNNSTKYHSKGLKSRSDTWNKQRSATPEGDKHEKAYGLLQKAQKRAY